MASQLLLLVLLLLFLVLNFELAAAPVSAQEAAVLLHQEPWSQQHCRCAVVLQAAATVSAGPEQLLRPFHCRPSLQLPALEAQEAARPHQQYYWGPVCLLHPLPGRFGGITSVRVLIDDQTGKCNGAQGRGCAVSQPASRAAAFLLLLFWYSTALPCHAGPPTSLHATAEH